MATLAEQDRFEIWAEYMREISGKREVVGISKSELRAAFDAADDWVNANSANFNAALPQPARGALSSSQKALLLQFVVDRRYLKGA